jgi:hypothetical protein
MYLMSSLIIDNNSRKGFDMRFSICAAMMSEWSFYSGLGTVNGWIGGRNVRVVKRNSGVSLTRKFRSRNGCLHRNKREASDVIWLGLVREGVT